MHVQDWFDKESDLLFTTFSTGLWRFMNHQDYGQSTPCYENQRVYPDRSDMGPIPFEGGIINGRGMCLFANYIIQIYRSFENFI